MGVLISRFRKKPTTEEQLKKIEEGLKRIEDYKRSTERKHKKLVASVIIYSAALYILACVVVFVWYLPESWMIRLALLIPLVLVPLIVYLFKRLISKFFDSKMIKANEEYADLQRKKKDIIDNVMETETFNKAKEILSKYAPEKLNKKEQPQISQPVVMTDLRKRNTPHTRTSLGTTPLRQSRVETIPSLSVVPRFSTPAPTRPVGDMVQKQRLPLPLFSKERGFTDKLVEFMIGDGPGYRYALICSHCRGHNGMALKEEFPYMAFNCCYCYQFNPARSKRPLPPKLPEPRELTAGPVPISIELSMRPPDPPLPPTKTEGEIKTEDGGSTEIIEKTDEDADSAEPDGSDKKNTEDLDIEDVKEEMSDEDFQNLGFSESDLECLRNSQACETSTTEQVEGPDQDEKEIK